MLILGLFPVGHHPPQPVVYALLLMLLDLVLEHAQLLLRSSVVSTTTVQASIVYLMEMVFERAII